MGAVVEAAEEEEGGSLPGVGDVGIDGWVDMMCVLFCKIVA